MNSLGRWRRDESVRVRLGSALHATRADVNPLAHAIITLTQREPWLCARRHVIRVRQVLLHRRQRRRFPAKLGAQELERLFHQRARRLVPLLNLAQSVITIRSLARPRVLDAIQVLVHVPTVDAEQSVLPLLDHPSRRVSRHLVARRTALIEPFARLPHPQHLDRSIRRLHVRPKRLRILADQILLVAVVLLKARVSRARHRVSMRLQTLLRLLSLRRFDRRDRRAQQKKMSHALPRARRPRALARESHRQQVSQRRRVDARARELFDRPEHRVARRSRRRARVAGRHRRHRVDRRDRASSSASRRRVAVRARWFESRRRRRRGEVDRGDRGE